MHLKARLAYAENRLAYAEKTASHTNIKLANRTRLAGYT